MHATLQVAAVLYIEALEMHGLYECVCVCVLASPVYIWVGEVLQVTVVTLSVCLCIWGGGGGGGVTVVILSVHMGRGYRLGAFEYTDYFHHCWVR